MGIKLTITNEVLIKDVSQMARKMKLLSLIPVGLWWLGPASKVKNHV